MYRPYLPLEENARTESEKLYAQWNRGCYRFILERTANYYNRVATSNRRKIVEDKIGLNLPPITDTMLCALYSYSMKRFKSTCFERFQHSGFEMTSSERQFQRTLETVLTNLGYTNQVEVYPSEAHSKDFPAQTRLVAGVHAPDFLIFGLKQKGFSSIAIEIDGDSHIHKASKDFQKYANLEQLGILALSVPAEKASDSAFIESIVRDLSRKRSGALDKQIASNKRKIWCKTIACHLSLSDVEEFVITHFRVELKLIAEAEVLANIVSCPREIKRELQANL